jgi:hypothetical protein
VPIDQALEQYGGHLTILVLSTLILGTLLILVPQLLRARLRTRELEHQERMQCLEKGHSPLPEDERSSSAGRVALLVPSVSIISAATVTCFLVAYHSEHLFSVSLAVWCVAGVVALAAITGGVALLGRIAQLTAGVEEEAEFPDEIVQK